MYQDLDLLSERVLGKVLLANDEFFAPKENLIKSAKPIFIKDKFTSYGKWMDGWETRRRRDKGYDWVLLKLGLAGTLDKIIVDTAFFRGNYPEKCSIYACEIKELNKTPEEILNDKDFTQIVSLSALKGDHEHSFKIDSTDRFTHIKFNIYPDGGVARLKAFGKVLPDFEMIKNRGTDIDLISLENGGHVIDASDMFFSDGSNLLLPTFSSHMGDGWETKRRRDDNHDFVVIALGHRGIPKRVEVDTTHFKGNAPDSFMLEVCDAPPEADLELLNEQIWEKLLNKTHLQPDTKHFFEHVSYEKPVTHVKLNIYPDGGVARFRLYGTLDD